MIVAVTGGKGGVGKTTVALNLGAELDAVVVDADLGMADLPTNRGPDLHDVLAGRADPVEAVREDGPVDLLPCGRTLAGARASDPAALVAAVEAVSAEYGDVVIDCPAGMAADAGVPLVAADCCVLVASPHEFALADAVRTRALARELDAGLAHVALNECGANPPVEEVRDLLGAPTTAVPEHEVVRRAGTSGQPVRSLAPACESAEAFRRMATAVQSCRS